MNIARNVTELVGNTPLVRLEKLAADLPATVLVKMETRNPLASVKDRLALAMIQAAEDAGRLQPGSHLVEPTSGNTGIALAFIAAQRGYRLTLCMPESMSMERRRILRAFGAELVLTPASDGMSGAIKEAETILARDPAAIMLQQFRNPANPAMHRRTTAEEIWRDTDGSVDILVAGVGTGGTFTGTASRLKELKPAVRAYAVEPAGSPVLSGGPKGPHKIQGIGAGFIPGVMDISLADGILAVEDEEAAAMTRRLARKEGLFLGVSAGANVAASLRLAADPAYEDRTIVTIGCDTGERYLSTWLWKNHEEE